MELEKAYFTFSSKYVCLTVALYCDSYPSVVCYIMQAAWHAELAALPVFGDGKNVLPTIHISDLARFGYVLGSVVI